LYSPELLAGLVANFTKLDTVDQVGLINDSRALGYAGYEPLSDFLSLASQANANMDPQALSVIADRINGLVQLYRGLPGAAAMNAYAQKTFEPILANVGWDAKPGENQNVALLRNSLFGLLSEADDAAVIGEGRKRFEAFVQDQQSMSGDLRRNVLQIVAVHADPAIWDQLHTLAKSTNDSLQKQEYYELLGAARDPALTQKALDLVLADEAPVTVRPSILDVVAFTGHPEMAVDFVAAHADAVNAMLEPDSRSQFVPRLASASYDPAIIPKLDAYATAHIAADARQEVVKAESGITYSAKIRQERLPDVDRWLASQGR
jgi:aminopeptidase N